MLAECATGSQADPDLLHQSVHQEDELTNSGNSISHAAFTEMIDNMPVKTTDCIIVTPSAKHDDSLCIHCLCTFHRHWPSTREHVTTVVVLVASVHITQTFAHFTDTGQVHVNM